MKTIKLLLMVFVGFFLFHACQKELSAEGGNTGRSATGTLKDSLERCTPVSVFGTYVTDSTLNADHYVLIQANFTTAGAYRISTNLVNGFSFSDSGYVSTPGIHTIKLKATGKPTLPGATEFDVSFGTSSCKVTVSVTGGGSGAVFTFAGSPGFCANANVQGTYTAGTALTAANKVTIHVNVTTPGLYTITAGPMNGMTFSKSGTFTTNGPQSVDLQSSGIPTTAGTYQFPIVAGASICAFAVSVNPAPGSGGTNTTSPDSAWSFNQGSLFFVGPMDSAYLATTAGGPTELRIEGSTPHAITWATGDTVIQIQVILPGSTIQPGTYFTSTNARFYYDDASSGTMGFTIYKAEPATNNVVMSVVISSYDSTTRVVQGTFSGTAQNFSGVPVNITNGRFRATVAQ